jgi:hypothetical protein
MPGILATSLFAGMAMLAGVGSAHHHLEASQHDGTFNNNKHLLAFTTRGSCG